MIAIGVVQLLWPMSRFSSHGSQRLYGHLTEPDQFVPHCKMQCHQPGNDGRSLMASIGDVANSDKYIIFGAMMTFDVKPFGRSATRLCGFCGRAQK